MTIYHLHSKESTTHLHLVDFISTNIFFQCLCTQFAGLGEFPHIIDCLKYLNSTEEKESGNIHKHLLATDELLLAFRTALKLGFIDDLYFHNGEGVIGFDPLTGNPNPTYINNFGEVSDSNSFNYDIGNCKYFLDILR